MANWRDIIERVLHGHCGAQTGVVPYRIVDGQVRYLLITSRRSRRWMFPKGNPISGLSPRDSAAREAFEEAGIEGDVALEPIGRYSSTRNNANRSAVRVAMYPMCVAVEHEDWLEREQRQRYWASLDEVRSLVGDRRLARIAARLESRVRRHDMVAG